MNGDTREVAHRAHHRRRTAVGIDTADAVIRFAVRQLHPGTARNIDEVHLPIARVEAHDDDGICPLRLFMRRICPLVHAEEQYIRVAVKGGIHRTDIRPPLLCVFRVGRLVLMVDAGTPADKEKRAGQHGADEDAADQHQKHQLEQGPPPFAAVGLAPLLDVTAGDADLALLLVLPHRSHSFSRWRSRISLRASTVSG